MVVTAENLKNILNIYLTMLWALFALNYFKLLKYIS
jgi:hypothetical protein